MEVIHLQIVCTRIGEHIKGRQISIESLPDPAWKVGLSALALLD